MIPEAFEEYCRLACGLHLHIYLYIDLPGRYVMCIYVHICIYIYVRVYVCIYVHVCKQWVFALEHQKR